MDSYQFKPEDVAGDGAVYTNFKVSEYPIPDHEARQTGIRQEILKNAEWLSKRADEIAACPSGIEKEVCEDIARRQQLGIAKYGKTVADNPLSLREWLQHALEESLDQAIYLKRAIAELEK